MSLINQLRRVIYYRNRKTKKEDRIKRKAIWMNPDVKETLDQARFVLASRRDEKLMTVRDFTELCIEYFIHKELKGWQSKTQLELKKWIGDL